jgi:cytochrome P450
MLAGHETTANSISFSLLELAKHPEVQMRIRQEIREMNFAKAARGESELDVQDLDSMQYTIAVVKVHWFR